MLLICCWTKPTGKRHKTRKQSLQEVEGCREIGDARLPRYYPQHGDNRASRHRELLEDLLELPSSFLLPDSPSRSVPGDILDAPHWHTFQRLYSPTKELAIDETMVGFRGRFGSIQYMPQKPTKWGIKAFTLADGANGYLLHVLLYTGAQTLENADPAFAALPVPGRVVMDVLGPYQGTPLPRHSLHWHHHEEQDWAPCRASQQCLPNWGRGSPSLSRRTDAGDGVEGRD